MNQENMKTVTKFKNLKWLLVGFLILAGTIAEAQKSPIYNQYMMNKYLVNPAVAGYKGFTSLNLTVREQWLGWQNAPGTYSVSGQTRILRNSFIGRSMLLRRIFGRFRPSGRVGLGAHIFKDQNGILDKTGMEFTYAYHIHSGSSQYSFGLSSTFYQFKADLNDIQNDELVNQSDDFLTANGNQAAIFVPDFNFGFLYSLYEFYAGVSMNNMLESWLQFGNGNLAKFASERNYHFISGYTYPIDDMFEVEGSVLAQSDEKFTNPIFNVSVKGTYLDDYWLGLSYRTDRAMIFLAGVSVKNFYFGYGFDYAFTSIQRYSYGSHEISFGVIFGDDSRRYRWLDRF